MISMWPWLGFGKGEVCGLCVLVWKGLRLHWVSCSGHILMQPVGSDSSSPILPAAMTAKLALLWVFQSHRACTSLHSLGVILIVSLCAQWFWGRRYMRDYSSIRSQWCQRLTTTMTEKVRFLKWLHLYCHILTEAEAALGIWTQYHLIPMEIQKNGRVFFP